MSENAVSTGIMSTASIITTIVIIAAAFVVAGSIGASINRSGENLADEINTDFDILGTGDVHAGNASLSVFLKNRGGIAIDSFQIVDIFLDGNFLSYDSSEPAQYRWNATIVNDNGNGVWDVYETVRVRIDYPTGSSITAGMHKITIIIEGKTQEYIFSI